MQAAGSTLPLLVVAAVFSVLISVLGYFGRGWIEDRRAGASRKAESAAAAYEAADEATALVKIENIKDLAAFRAELWERVELLEGRATQLQKDSDERLQQAEARHAADLAREVADHAQERAAEARRHEEQLLALREENANCKESLAVLRIDLVAWQHRAAQFADMMAAAGQVLRQPVEEEEGVVAST